MFGSPETTTGGNALKFYCSVRMDIRRIETIKNGTDAIGSRARVKVVKNKVAPPFRQAEFDIMYNEGISVAGSILDVATDMGIVKKSGAWFNLGDERLGQGRENAKTYLQHNPDVLNNIKQQIMGGSAEFTGRLDLCRRRGWRSRRHRRDHRRLERVPSSEKSAARGSGIRSAGRLCPAICARSRRFPIAGLDWAVEMTIPKRRVVAPAAADLSPPRSRVTLSDHTLPGSEVDVVAPPCGRHGVQNSVVR